MMVVSVQAALMRLGIDYSDTDGLLGPKTRLAIRTYQRQNDLMATSTINLDTLSRLGIGVK